MNADNQEMKISSSFIKDVEGIIKDVNNRLKKISNPTHADIYDLLHGNLIPMDRRNDNKNREPNYVTPKRATKK